MISLRVNVETVAVVRPESRGKAELDVPGVREHSHYVGQGQVHLLLADGGILRPGEVTAKTSVVHRFGISQVRISRKEIFRLDGKADDKQATQSPRFSMLEFLDQGYQ